MTAAWRRRISKGASPTRPCWGQCGIIDQEEAERNLREGLKGILADLQSGALEIDPEAEDIHTFVEGELTARLGDAGKRLHTARSRNDQVALDVPPVPAKSSAACSMGSSRNLIEVLCNKAEDYTRHGDAGLYPSAARPAHHLWPSSDGLCRDAPAGLSAGLQDAGAAHGRHARWVPARWRAPPIRLTAAHGASCWALRGVTHNSLDGVSDRDFCHGACRGAFHCDGASLPLLGGNHPLVLAGSSNLSSWTTPFPPALSIMPQKKNPDIAELVRGKTGRVFGDLMTLLTMMKGLPLAYNKDMQEDKEAVFDAVDTVQMCLTAFTPMVDTMTVLPENMRKAAAGGFINATDCADYLVSKGLPFRDAYKATGTLVARCIELGLDAGNPPSGGIPGRLPRL